MKILINKLKKCNKVFLLIYLITFIVFAIAYGILVKNLLSLSGIETIIRFIVIIFFGIWLIAYFLWNLINLILKKHVTIAITTSLTIIFAVIFSFANYYIGVLYKGIGNLQESEYVTYTSNLVVLNGNKIDNNSKLGMINSSDDIEGHILAKELIKDKKLECEVVNYSSYYEMIYDLLHKEIDGIFLTPNYMAIFGSEEGFTELKNTSAIYTYSKKMENQDINIGTNKNLTEPFTILLMGVDSANASFNGDTLMLITFNPKTLNATMFSIPRDTYVPIACNNNRYAKINSSAAYGTSCVISTIENLTDIKIDYYLKINFKGVVDLVEALGGVDVDVEGPTYWAYKQTYNGKICEQDSLRRFGDNLICIDPGMQTLNGEQALAYARCRHAYLYSDIDRNKHQQQIIEAMARKLASPSNINKIEDLLNAVTNNLATNMSTKQILSFYDVLKEMISKSFNDGDFIKIQKTYMEYSNLNVRISNNGPFTSAITYHNDSMEAIKKAMRINLGLEKKEMVKTFSFDANEEYTSKVIGRGLRSGGVLEVVPNFVGGTVKQAEEWANNNNISFRSEFVDSSDVNYNASIAPGLVANQSINRGVLVNSVEELVVYINDSTIDIPTPEPPIDDNDDENTDIPDNPLDIILPSDNNKDDENKTNPDDLD
mgnify:CR=1 FL=1